MTDNAASFCAPISLAIYKLPSTSSNVPTNHDDLLLIFNHPILMYYAAECFIINKDLKKAKGIIKNGKIKCENKLEFKSVLKAFCDLEKKSSNRSNF